MLGYLKICILFCFVFASSWDHHDTTGQHLYFRREASEAQSLEEAADVPGTRTQQRCSVTVRHPC